jgi:hypothetical protein
MKLHINNLVVEVTRRCNIKCEHCLRGNAQPKSVAFKDIDKLLSQCNYISQVTFTGGEPTINVPAINYFLEQSKKLSIGIGSFYIVTNGVKISEEFVLCCLKLFSYAEDKEICSVQLSNDMFHISEKQYSTELLQGLSFFSKRNTKDGFNYNGFSSLLYEGRAKNLISKSRRDWRYSSVTCKDEFDNTEIYLNCEGQIIKGCDWSYVNQKKHILCSVDNLTNYYNTLPDDTTKN